MESARHAVDAGLASIGNAGELYRERWVPGVGLAAGQVDRERNAILR